MKQFTLLNSVLAVTSLESQDGKGAYLNEAQLQAFEDAISGKDNRITELTQHETNYNNAVDKLNALHPDVASAKDLAEKVNVSNNHISSIETGKQIPSLTTFVKICEQLDTTPDFLLLGSLHTDNLPKNIYDSLALCNKKDLPLIQDIVENFVSKRE